MFQMLQIKKQSGIWDILRARYYIILLSRIVRTRKSFYNLCNTRALMCGILVAVFFPKVKAPCPLLRIGVVDRWLEQCHRASLCARLPRATYFEQNQRTEPLKTAMGCLSIRKTKSSIVSSREQTMICWPVATHGYCAILYQSAWGENFQ
jgi:hypothetical protein